MLEDRLAARLLAGMPWERWHRAREAQRAQAEARMERAYQDETWEKSGTAMRYEARGRVPDRGHP